MAKQASTAHSFADVDVSSLPPKVAKAYAASRKVYADHMAVIRKAQSEFEDMARAAYHAKGTVPEGQEVFFGYKFGKLRRWFDYAPEVKGAKAGTAKVAFGE